MQEVHGKRKHFCLPIGRQLLTVFMFFTFQPLEIFVDDETKLTLHGLQQHYVKMEEVGKNRKLNELLDTLDFNQVSSRCPSLGFSSHNHARFRSSSSSSPLHVPSSLTSSLYRATSLVSRSIPALCRRSGKFRLCRGITNA